MSDIGSHDLTIIMGTESNRFRAENNGKSLVLDLVVTIYKDILLLQPPNLSAPAAVKVVDGVQVKANPVVIPGIYTPHGNDIVVTGGDIQGHSADDGSYVITRIVPLRAHWSNRLTPRQEQDYVANA